jgi:hypothetical protein
MPPLSPSAYLSAGEPTSASVRELVSGVDALYLSVWAEIPEELLRRLDLGRAVAQAGQAPVPFEFAGVQFGLAPHAWHRYRYLLQHEFGLVGISPSTHLPPIRIQPRAEFLHGLGVESVVDAFRTMLEMEVAVPWMSVARLDLFADFQGWPVDREPESSFVVRAKDVTLRSQRGRRTGLQFGKRSSGTIVGRIYNKTAEIAQSGHGWWYDMWAERYVCGQPVWRVEFEFDRSALKQFELDPVEKVLARAGGLWAYATETWLTHRTPSRDQTRSRWPVSAAWAQVQLASLRGDDIGLNRALDRKQEAKLEALVPVLRGCFTSAAAHWGADGIDDGVACLNAYLHEWEGLTGHTVAGAIAIKRRNWGWGL